MGKQKAKAETLKGRRRKIEIRAGRPKAKSKDVEELVPFYPSEFSADSFDRSFPNVIQPSVL
jgi:hypothetical protein